LNQSARSEDTKLRCCDPRGFLGDHALVSSRINRAMNIYVTNATKLLMSA
jgi:hypothetical protein